ncbi:MAG TPA: hypothetical protein VN025_04790 [Candidatus Dormibacteraeota bacterium]|jgi:hypothetical protein|nr:hypothetical protein [Candidatus Dormibacteraeota bacterium]
MKRVLLVVLSTASCAFAQEKGNVIYQTTGAAGAVFSAGFDKAAGPVIGAPYSATITNESTQTLADGNRLVRTSTGTTARDSQGRTRQDTVLPPLGNLSAANAPHLIFIHDPIAQTSYTLNLTEKTAQKMVVPPSPPPPPFPANGAGVAGATVTMRVVEGNEGQLPPPDAMPVTVAAPAAGMVLEKHLISIDQSQSNTEELGSQTMEGVVVNGVRTTHTIPAGQIGNERPIMIVTEVWTSPELKTIVYSKRSDPRMGEQTFRLTNIVRTEPSPSLFTVPSDFKIVDGPQTIFYKTKQ